ncbi:MULTISPECIES: DUF5350 domain-containing protein [Methanoculleus]|jgi:hypothetical protein|uniref:DUF5350 family protein n=1 Tax=Methanoculleus thermophilus TaxID=2200 RepID=A0A1G8XYG4_9EURY|nr:MULTISPECIES: DUF5350 domain-containing protein [Methanoculleus]NLN09322.1 DUF5350 family protein [Methanoculleus thermophilus]SDJ95573.1 hypothetical protein SAMN04488571_102119 [Methanoculleus thermophilus]HQD26678.1 DUF5350 domain-containing protein [Methanoculleus thermophilus]
MGKTGSVLWAQVKGVKGQIRLVPASEGEVKKPGPNQRFKPAADIYKRTSRDGQDPRRGGRGGRGRSASGSGRGRGSAPTMDVRVRRCIRRAKVSALGTKQKSR